MNQIVNEIAIITVVLTWMDDNKVYIKYFFKGNEIPDYHDLTDLQKCEIELYLNDFFEKNIHLIKWSY